MPKMKTNRAAAKRFKLTASGKVKRRTAATCGTSTRTRPRKRKRQLRQAALVDKADERNDQAPAAVRLEGGDDHATRQRRSEDPPPPQEDHEGRQGVRRRPAQDLPAGARDRRARAHLRLPRPQADASAISAACGSSRINAAARQHGLSYSRLIAGLKAAGVTVDRKILAALALDDARAFGELAGLAKAQLPATA